ncbi:TetR/AcrR family transcriptional regulator [Dyella amyloliquefaciens]|uniref:TetR/AcrR family transcriptional regulator n=1 Tax=Dyella amyloliquefaciens TaxID=1770545 RepID=UPI00102E4C52|nr:TetR/AcrR family transcriptional regulator [Dyella amyloliquefaciens]
MAYQRSPLMKKRLSDNRQQIKLAARRLIALGGFREASITAVAQNVGLSTGAIYRYFPSKAELFIEVLGDAVSHEVTILRGLLEGEGSPVDQLYAAVESFATRALKGPHLAYAFIAEPIDSDVEAARMAGRAQFIAVFEDILRAGIKRGFFPAQMPDVAAACIVGAFTEALIRPVAPAARPADDKKLVKAIASLCVRAAGVAISPVETTAKRVKPKR